MRNDCKGIDNKSENEGGEQQVDALRILIEYYLLCELLQSTGTQNLLRYTTGRGREEI